MSTQSGRRRAASWDGSSSRPSSSRGSNPHHQANKQQDCHFSEPGVCLLGLPKNTATADLEDLFAEYGVSSVQIVETPQRSTDIAFVNFYNDNGAQEVCWCAALCA
jgi:RNA recognition motif-containing protein